MLDRLDQPLKVRKPFRVFVCSMSDLFHEDVPEAAIAEIFGVMAVANNVFQGKSDGFKNQTIGGKVVARWPNMKSGPHSFILLTKRTDRMRDLLLSGRFRESVSAAAYRHAIDRVDAGHLAHAISSRNEWGRCYEPGSLWPLPNVWIGVTAENQARYDERVPILMSIPAKVRFVSIEPMLGPVLTVLHPKPEWIIAGPENGSGARPCNPKWIEDVKDQCEFGRIPFFDKRDTEGAVRQMPWSLEGII
jgi:protein gp37